jgi:hypothetical protein
MEPIAIPLGEVLLERDPKRRCRPLAGDILALRISNAVSRASVDDTSGKGAVLAGPRWRPAPSPSLRLEIAPRTLAGPGVRIEVVLISACPSVADTKVIGAPLSIA